MLTEILKNKIIEYLGYRTKSENWNITDPGIESTDSIVYRFSNPDYHRDFALKVYRLDKKSKIGPHYSSIKRFAGLLNTNNSKYHVPEPYGLFLEDDCFLMEWATGVTLKDILWKNCLRKDRLQTHIKEGYHWLKYFHQHADLELKCVDTSRYLVNLKNHINHSHAEWLSNSNDVFKTGLETLTNFESKFTDLETNHADIHGDLNLSNIIVEDTHITGIDIGGMHKLPVEDDMAQMLNYICINYFNMLPRSTIKESRSMWNILNLSLNAYDYPNDKKTRDFFLYVFLYQMLYRWVSVTNIHKPDKDNTLTFNLLGRWRLYNSSAITKGLIGMINERVL